MKLNKNVVIATIIAFIFLAIAFQPTVSASSLATSTDATAITDTASTAQQFDDLLGKFIDVFSQFPLIGLLVVEYPELMFGLFSFCGLLGLCGLLCCPCAIVGVFGCCSPLVPVVLLGLTVVLAATGAAIWFLLERAVSCFSPCIALVASCASWVVSCIGCILSLMGATIQRFLGVGLACCCPCGIFGPCACLWNPLACCAGLMRLFDIVPIPFFSQCLACCGLGGITMLFEVIGGVFLGLSGGCCLLSGLECCELLIPCWNCFVSCPLHQVITYCCLTCCGL